MSTERNSAHDARWVDILSTMIPPRTRTVSIGVAVLGLAAGVSLAQSNEYRMDESGNWVQIKGAQPGTDEAVIAAARKELAEERPGDAKRIISEWIERNERSQNPLLAEALAIRGDALTALGDEYEALYDYERVIKEFPATPSFVIAVERELDIGVRYCAGMRRKVLGARILDATDIGEELLIRVQERMPSSRLAERAGIELADYYYRERDLKLAVDAYDLFIQNYPNSQYKQRAMQRRVYATIGRFKGPRYDGSALIDAKILTRRYASLYPAEAQKAGLDDGLLTRLDESAAQEFLETGSWYLRQKDDVSARLVLKRLVRAHPQTAAAQKAVEIMKEKGWAVDQPTSPMPVNEEPSVPAKAESAPVESSNEAERPAKGERPPPVEPRRKRSAEPEVPLPSEVPGREAGKP